MKHRVILAATGDEFFCPEELHLLQGMQRFQMGLATTKLIPVGCRGGGCGVCRIRIAKGQYKAKKMSSRHITEEDLARGVVLACRVNPRSDLLIEVLSLPD